MSDISMLIQQIKEFCEQRDWDQFHSPKELAIGLSTESNELLDIFRFKTEEQMAEMLQTDEKREEISDELADIFFFLLRFSQMYDLDLKEGLEKKLRKNNEKYPVAKIKGKNLKYTELSLEEE